MGKQINYWMDYDNFCQLANLALELGCIIIKEDPEGGKIVKATDISIITKDCYRYYFYFSDAGPLKIKKVENRELIERFNTETGNAIIGIDVIKRMTVRIKERIRVFILTSQK